MPDRELEQIVNDAVAELYNVTVEVLPYGLSAYTAPALFESQYAEAENVGGFAPVLHGKASDLDPDGCIDGRANVWVDGDLYRVADQRPDGTGWVVWRLEKDAKL